MSGRHAKVDAKKIRKPTTLVPRVLFLRNAFLKECRTADDLAEERWIGDGLTSDYAPAIKYTKIPRVFRDFATWPKSTNLHCCWCTLPYTGIPIPFVTGIERVNSDAAEFIVDIDPSLQFSSFNCYLAYINMHSRSISERITRMNMAKLIYRMFHNEFPTVITPAISPTRMKHFGGDLSIDEYRAIVANVDKQDDGNFDELCSSYARVLLVDTHDEA